MYFICIFVFILFVSVFVFAMPWLSVSRTTTQIPNTTNKSLTLTVFAMPLLLSPLNNRTNRGLEQDPQTTVSGCSNYPFPCRINFTVASKIKKMWQRLKNMNNFSHLGRIYNRGKGLGVLGGKEV